MYCQNESRFNRVYLRDYLPYKIKDGAYVINLDEYADIGTHGIALYANDNTKTYFDSLESNTFQKKPNSSLKDLCTITRNIFRIQRYDSVMCGCFCIGFIGFMLKDTVKVYFFHQHTLL